MSEQGRQLPAVQGREGMISKHLEELGYGGVIGGKLVLAVCA